MDIAATTCLTPRSGPCAAARRACEGGGRRCQARDATQLLDAQRLELERLQAEQRELEAQVAEIQARNQRYEHILATLKRLQFGRSSERLDKDQLNLAFEDLVQGLAEIEQAEERADPALKTHRARERREKRPSLPDHLAEVEVVLEPEQTVCPCCTARLIGSVKTSPGGSMWCRRVVPGDRDPPPQIRLPCLRGHDRSGPGAGAVDRGRIATERLVATVIVDKYAATTCRSTGKPRPLPARASP